MVNIGRSPSPSPPATPIRPFLKWAGGKTQLLQQFEALYPEGPIARYFEPFLGSGAVFFTVRARLAPKACILSDSNAEIINVFRAVQQDVDRLIAHLDRHKQTHARDPEATFYDVRAHVPDDELERAARLIYLNKTCFNGLYRVNSRGLFNVPFGRPVNPGIYDEVGLRAASASLRGVTIEVRDFRETAKHARPRDFVYFDPPYDPISKTSYFTSYSKDAFGRQEQTDLADVAALLAAKGCFVMLSNSNTPFVRKLYKARGLHLVKVSARRTINSNAARRGPIKEVVACSYAPPARRNREAE